MNAFAHGMPIQRRCFFFLLTSLKMPFFFGGYFGDPEGSLRGKTRQSDSFVDI